MAGIGVVRRLTKEPVTVIFRNVCTSLILASTTRMTMDDQMRLLFAALRSDGMCSLERLTNKF
jgi:hypothetical protein